MSAIQILLYVYAGIILIIGISICFDDSTYEDFIRPRDIESILDIILFVFSGPSLVVAYVLKTIFEILAKALTCKFREKK